MKCLRLSAVITGLLGFLSIISIIFLFLALSDIANREPDLTLEWHIAGISIIVIASFTVSTLVTLGLLFKSDVFK